MSTKESFLNTVLKEEQTSQTNPRRKQSKFSQYSIRKNLSDQKRDTDYLSRLLVATGFDKWTNLLRKEVILGDNPAAKHLSDRAYYFKSSHYQALYFELTQSGTELLNHQLFRDLKKQLLLEDALHRLIQYVLEGFSRGGEKRTADVYKGLPDETLVIIKVKDDRFKNDAPSNMLAFGTVNKETGSLESFIVRDEFKDWIQSNPTLAQEHLVRLYYRHFEKMQSPDWQNAFVSGKERDKAKALLEISKEGEAVHKIKAVASDLITTIAESFGKRKDQPKLRFSDLSENHFIGANLKAASKSDYQNAFEGVSIRDSKERLLGYILYCFNHADEAKDLNKILKKENVFDNVLVIYPEEDQTVMELWQGSKKLKGKLTRSGARFEGVGQVVNLISRFFVVSQSRISTPKELSVSLAKRAKYLRIIAEQELNQESQSWQETSSEQTYKDSKANAARFPVLNLYHLFDRSLVRQSFDEFADTFAQTLTYGLLAARWMSRHHDLAFTAQNIESLLPESSVFLKDIFHKLIDLRLSDRLAWLIDDLISLLHRTAVDDVFADEDRDPVIHFYEDFLDEYDPKIRATRGVYYTPDEVVQYIVNTTHNLLIDEFHMPLGLADTSTWQDYAQRSGESIPEGIDPEAPFVQILDPATGTGTFLKYTIDVIHNTMMSQWAGADWASNAEQQLEKHISKWQAYVHAHLLPRLNGFELMMAPYIVCHLRLGIQLQETGITFQGEDRLRVFLTNTLEQNNQQQMSFLGEHVAAEAQLADEVKNQTPINVIIGNPPYERELPDENGQTTKNGHANHKGGWIREGVNGQDPILNDYTHPESGIHFKNAYNLYVYFWRWANWKLESKPGICSFITASSYLRGPGFKGLRQLWRQRSDKLYILDLEGDQLGANKTENVFNIRTPVCISTLLNKNSSNSWAGYYERVIGSKSQKLLYCQSNSSISQVDWNTLSTVDIDSFIPISKNTYNLLPSLTSLFPWQHSGCQFKRKWPISHSQKNLVSRWKELFIEDLSTKFKETRDRKTHKSYRNLFNSEKFDSPLINETNLNPILMKYSYRSFDNQWCIADNRVGDFIRPDLWRSHSDLQIYLSSLLTKSLGEGTSLVVSKNIPDMDHFCNRGAKDIIPLWRNAEATEPNINHSAWQCIESVYGFKPEPEDLYAYVYSIMAHPGYEERFREELQIPGPRIPITKDPELFKKGVTMGRHLIHLQTFGERMGQKNEFTLSGNASLHKPIPDTSADYPENFKYDSKKQVLKIGEGEIHNVAPEIFGFSVSGLQVVKSWLKYRMKKGAGRKSSPLDDIRPEVWTEEMTQDLMNLLHMLEETLKQYPVLDAYLDDVLESELFTEKELPEPTEEETTPPKVERSDEQLSLF